MLRCAVQSIYTTKFARPSNQSFCRGAFAVVHSRCRKFLKHVHNLFTRRLWLLSPDGLRLEISCENDKKKMNLIFNYDQKIFLTGKRSARVDLKTQTVCRKGFARAKPRPFRIPRMNSLRCCFPAHLKLTELVRARNFPPLRAEGKRSANCRCRQPIPIPTGVFRWPLPVRTSR